MTVKHGLPETLEMEGRVLRGPASPCVGICVIQPATGWCQGCRRTLGEIARWSGASPAEQWQIIERLSQRAEVAGGAR